MKRTKKEHQDMKIFRLLQENTIQIIENINFKQWENQKSGDLALIIIVDCKTAKLRDLKKELGFNLHDVINTK